MFPQSCNDLEIILEKKPYNVALESQVIHKSIPKYLLILEEMLQLRKDATFALSLLILL